MNAVYSPDPFNFDLAEHYMHGTTWEWSITVPMAMPVWANGTAESRDAAIKDFSVAWGKAFRGNPSGTPCASLARW